MGFSKRNLFTFLCVSIVLLTEIEGVIAAIQRAASRESTAIPQRSEEDLKPTEPCQLNLCFAVDGSASVSSNEFSRQQFLVKLLVQGIPQSQALGLAGVQYGVASVPLALPISLVTVDRTDFIRQVGGAVQQEGAGTFLVAPINFCFSELFKLQLTTSRCQQNKIILMGDGRGNIGADPVDRARLFEEELDGKIVTVAFGKGPDISGLIEIAGGENNFINARVDNIRNVASTILKRLGF